MIKRLFPMLLAVLILSTTVYAAGPELSQTELPEGITVTDITEHTAAAEYSPPQFYPTDIQTKTEDGVKLLLKTFEVSADVAPSALIEGCLTPWDTQQARIFTADTEKRRNLLRAVRAASHR